MRSQFLVLSVVVAAGCGGRAATTADTAPAPASRPAAAADPTTLRYAPGTVRYRYEQNQQARQEVMGNVQETDATSVMVISASFTPADGGNLGASFTVDSITVTTQTPGGAAALEGMRGKTFRAIFSTLGRSVSFTPPDSSVVAAMSGEMFKDFLPTLPAGSIAAGTAWTDTVNAPPTNAQGLTLRTSAIRSHRVVGWEMRDGARVLHVSTTGNYTISGEGEQGGTPLQLAGTGVATSERFITPAGHFVAATTHDSTNIRVTAVAMGLEIPVRQVRRTTMTRLP